LVLHLQGDIRAQTALQDFVGTAPLNLVYVAHGERIIACGAPPLRLGRYRLHRQNVYLICASEGLATAIDYPMLARSFEVARSAVRSLCADGWISPRLSAEAANARHP